MIETVERPSAGWWALVVPPMALLGLVAYGSRTWSWWTRTVTGSVPRRAYRAVFWAAVTTHAAEAAVAVRRAERAGLTGASWSWGAQTFVVGFPSLLLLRKHATPD